MVCRFAPNYNTNQNAKHFDLRGETYEGIVRILLAKFFNPVICLDEANESGRCLFTSVKDRQGK